MMTVKTTIRNSTIEGVGVFAAERIPAGTIIWLLDERFDLRFNKDDVANFPHEVREYLARYGYPHMETPSIIVLEMDNGRFMNHDLNPNTNFTQPDRGWAIRDIDVGEEITCNYSEFDAEFDGFLLSHNCNQSVNQVVDNETTTST
ncbi:MAG: hypothetical protein RLZ98_3050 [Pseudomonadota bacterium]|jgi:SET domain-containing protein